MHASKQRDGAPDRSWRPPHHELLTTRRDFLRRGGAGFGALALAHLLQRSATSAATAEPASVFTNPLRAQTPAIAPRAKSVIFLFMEGGPSHLDLFDPKPLERAWPAKPIAAEFRQGHHGHGRVRFAAAGRESASGNSTARAASGFPTGCRTSRECVDDIAVIRSCWADGINHSGGVCQMNTGSILGGPAVAGRVGHLRPRHREREPARVRRHAGQRHASRSTARATGAPASCRPSIRARAFSAGSEPIPNLNTPKGITAAQQRGKLDLLNQLNRHHAASAAASRPSSKRASPATNSPFACRPKRRTPSISRRKPRPRKTLYGMDEKETATFGRMCLLGRRLVERGVRFVQLYHGAGSKWDAHAGSKRITAELCRADGQAGRRACSRI